MSDGDLDVLVAGGGYVGLSLALALKQADAEMRVRHPLNERSEIFIRAAPETRARREQRTTHRFISRKTPTSRPFTGRGWPTSPRS